MTIDQRLIARAQAVAGRHVHSIAGLIQGILMAEQCIKAGDKTEDWQAMIDKSERKLRIFIATGNLGK